MKRAFALVLFVSACGGPAKSTPSPSAPEPSPATTPVTAEPAAAEKPVAPDPAIAACKEQVTTLSASIRGWADAQPGFLPLVQGIKAPVSAGAKAVDNKGIVVAVTKDGSYYVVGQKIGAKELSEYLWAAERDHREQVGMQGRDVVPVALPVYVWADRDAPIKAVAGVLAATEEPKGSKSSKNDPRPPDEDEGGTGTAMALEEGRMGDAGPKKAPPAKPGKPEPHFTVRLIVTGAENPPPVSTEAAPAGVTLPATEPDSTKYFVEQMKTGWGTCEGVITPIAVTTPFDTTKKEIDRVVNDVPTGLQSCSCKVGNPMLFAWGLRTWFGTWAPALQWVEMPKLKTSDKRVIGKLVK